MDIRRSYVDAMACGHCNLKEEERWAYVASVAERRINILFQSEGKMLVFNPGHATGEP